MPKNIAENIHQPVLLAETLKLLKPQAGEIFVDATLGLGGHTEAILAKNNQTRVVGIDRDAEAIELAKEDLKNSAKGSVFSLELFRHQASFKASRN